MLAVYEHPWPGLADLNCVLIELLRAALGVDTPLIRDDEVCGVKEQLLAAICAKHGGTTYLSGNGARDYLTEERLGRLAAEGFGHRFVRSNLGREHPYAALHDVFTRGAAETIALLRAAVGVEAASPAR